MPLNLSVPAITELEPVISVIGVGGAGGNAVNNMISSALSGVDFIAANTDAQAIGLSSAPRKIQLGTTVTQGLGAGSQPQIGAAAAEESLDEVMEHIGSSNMLFITAGMGGGTGTGAAPVIARAARERGILTVGVVTKPFHFEGARRMRLADEGIKELQQYVDTLLIIPNQNLFRLADDNTTFADAFAMADEVLHAGVRSITDLMILPGHINLDFSDVRSVMSEMGKAMMGTGEAAGERRAAEAADAAISNPLLDEVSMKGAKGVLINITGGLDMKLFEVDEAANRIRSEVDPEANIIVGSTFSDDMEGKMRVSVVATGIEAEAILVKDLEPGLDPTRAAGQPSSVTSGYAPSIPGLPDLPAAEPAFTATEEGGLFAHQLPEAPAREHPVPGAERSGHSDNNPVGDVHERIRKILADDDQGAVPHGTLSNPFQTGEEREVIQNNISSKTATRTPLKSAMTKLKDTLTDAAKLSASGLARTDTEGGMPSASASHRSSAASVSEGTQAAPPARASAPMAQESPEENFNLFENKTDEDLEIPAFLRRRNY